MATINVTTSDITTLDRDQLIQLVGALTHQRDQAMAKVGTLAPKAKRWDEYLLDRHATAECLLDDATDGATGQVAETVEFHDVGGLDIVHDDLRTSCDGREYKMTLASKTLVYNVECIGDDNAERDGE